MNLLSSFEKEMRGSLSNSSGFWGKLDKGGAGKLLGDSPLAIVVMSSNLWSFMIERGVVWSISKLLL